ncbi:MAG: hypothetical protein IJV56_09205 [Neisseriaceae bacterium]|nr:hypothetical protein [Neisseriaceae bacterium]
MKKLFRLFKIIFALPFFKIGYPKNPIGFFGDCFASLRLSRNDEIGFRQPET